MKALKISAFASVVLYFIVDFLYLWEQSMLGPFYNISNISDLPTWTLHIFNKLYVIDQYRNLTLYVSVTLVLIYLFKRLK
jgi:hypothetical protein